VVDNEMVTYTKRILRGFDVEDATLAVDVIKEVGHDGQYLAHPHTVSHFREEFWIPTMWNRSSWETWLQEGGKSMAERAAEKVQEILETHEPEPMDEALVREIDSIVEAAKRHLL
jgi:trimethylamine--corrinoid protein Co-methyltransferase